MVGFVTNGIGKAVIAKMQADAIGEEYHQAIYSRAGPEMVIIIGEQGQFSHIPVPPHVKYAYPYVVKKESEQEEVQVDKDI